MLEQKTIKGTFRLLLLILTAFTIFNLFNPDGVLAATDVSLSPSSGTISGNQTIDVDLNTNGDDVQGVDLTITYSGALDYSSGSAGDISGCTPSIDESGGEISIICFFAPGASFSGTGTVANLVFSSSGTGSASIQVTSADFSNSTVGNLGSSSYTVSGSNDNNDDDLPDTALESWKIALGVGFISLGFSIILTTKFGYKLMRNSLNEAILIEDEVIEHERRNFEKRF